MGTKSKTKPWILIAVIVAVVPVAALALVACGLFGITGVFVDTPILTALNIGDTLPLRATVRGTGFSISQTVEWQSSDTSVASVYENGIVTAYAPGDATITATAVGTSISGAINITVNQPREGGSKSAVVSAGDRHSLAIDIYGNLWAWGDNMRGQLGDGTKVSSHVPIQIMQGTTFSQISAGGGHSLAIDTQGNLWTWGASELGQRGNGFSVLINYHLPPFPTHIMPGTKFSQISAGGFHSLAIDTHGNLWAWDSSRWGQIGDGTAGWSDFSPTPVHIMQGIKFSNISTGSAHSLAIDSQNDVWAWGWVGIGADESRALTDINAVSMLSGASSPRLPSSRDVNAFPIRIMQNTELSQISAGGEHSLLIDTQGNLWAWGDNCCGQLGDGTLINRPAPVAIALIEA